MPDLLRRLDTLHWALLASVLVHGVLLTIRFVDPERFDRLFEDTPLEVILVNAKSTEKPDPRHAQAIAQHALAGGGDAERGRATTPTPASALTELGDDAEEEQKRIEALQQRQQQIMAEIRRQLDSLNMPRAPADQADTADRAVEERRRQLLQLLAEIERRINQENARPRKRFISPSTREAEYAVYYDRLRRKIEDKGTENFPELAGQKLYGELTMIVTVDQQGRVVRTEVVESSGNRALDRRAEAIVREAGPFGRFSPEMRRKSDQIVVVSRFKFTREDTLETKLREQ